MRIQGRAAGQREIVLAVAAPVALVDGGEIEQSFELVRRCRR